MPDTVEKTETNKNETTVVHVRFKTGNKTSILEMNNIDAEVGNRVVAESDIGLSLGTIIKPKEIIEKTKEPLKKVLRIANENDFKTDGNNRSFEGEAKLFCSSKANKRKLQMKVVATESTLDRKKLIFYFTADNRVDFRELVRDLASKFKTRIEMRQIGVRDEVKLVGGIGVCGRETCCSRFLNHFEPISIKMAKKQELSINQGKLSGICGRLMCCLNYELTDSDKKKVRVSAAKKKKGTDVIESTLEETTRTVQPLYDAVKVEEKKKEGAPASKTLIPLKEEKDVNPEEAGTGKSQQPSKKKAGKGRHGKPDKGSCKKPDSKQKKQGKSSSKRRGFWKKKKKKQNDSK